MLFITFATTMMFAMLIATAYSLHQESQRVKLENRIKEQRHMTARRGRFD